MRKQISQGLLVIAGGILFSLVFWQEKLGINTVLFDAFILAAIFYLYANARQNAVVRWLLIGHLICLAMIVLHNTLLSKIAFATTLLLIVGFSEYIHRSAWFAGGSVLLNIVFCFASFAEQFKRRKSGGKKRKGLNKLIRFAIFPLLLLALFFIIYFSANSVFQVMASRMELYVAQFFNALFGVFSPQRYWLPPDAQPGQLFLCQGNRPYRYSPTYPNILGTTDTKNFLPVHRGRDGSFFKRNAGIEE